MDSIEEKRRHKRVPHHSPILSILLTSETPELERIPSNGDIVNASSVGMGVLTDFPLRRGHVLEWDDKHERGKLHIALKWSAEEGNRCRAGLMFI